MKRIILLSAFLITLSASAQKIEPVQIGIGKIADSIGVRVLTFKTTDLTCQLYYSVFNADKKQIDEGNLDVNEQEFSLWGQDNIYIENLALEKLNLTRKNK